MFAFLLEINACLHRLIHSWSDWGWIPQDARGGWGVHFQKCRNAYFWLSGWLSWPPRRGSSWSRCGANHSNRNYWLYSEWPQTVSAPLSLNVDSFKLNYRKLILSIIKAYIAFHLRRNKQWNAQAVTELTPKHIINFILQKCGPKESGYEGRKVGSSLNPLKFKHLTHRWLSIQLRSLLVQPWPSGINMFSPTRVPPSGGLTLTHTNGEWFEFTHISAFRNFWPFDSYGLPTRSRDVSRFMLGLERSKAQAGEVSQSACALNLTDMFNLHKKTFNPSLSTAELRQGIVRWVRTSNFITGKLPIIFLRPCTFWLGLLSYGSTRLWALILIPLTWILISVSISTHSEYSKIHC